MYVCNSNTSCILFNHFHIIDPYGSSDSSALLFSTLLFLTVFNNFSLSLQLVKEVN